MMEISIKTTNLELTSAIESYVYKKVSSLAKFLKNIDSSVQEARVEIGKPSGHHRKGKVFYAEINLRLPGKLLRAASKNWDLMTAIDDAKDEMQIQIKRYKERWKDLNRKKSKLS